MKKSVYTFLILSIIFFYQCSNSKKEININDPIVTLKIFTPEFQTILDAANVTGSILIYDIDSNRMYSNNFSRCDSGYIPASTYKIVNSIIALETGVAENDSTMFFWDGNPRRLQNWEQDMTLKEAFHYSCVPCYQEIARKIGPAKMNYYLDTFQYGNMIVNDSTIDKFWLEGESTVSQYQQIEFLRKLYFEELPLKDITYETMKQIMVIEENENYKLSGKTGWSIRQGNNVGWFVGYLEKGDQVYFFATNIEPNESFSMDLFPVIRKEITVKAFKTLNII